MGDGAAGTIASAHRKHEAAELKTALQRMALVFSIVPPLLFPVDAVVLYWGRPSAAAATVLIVDRLAGFAIALAIYLGLKRTKTASLRALMLVDVLALTVAGVIVGTRAATLGASMSAAAPGLQAVLLIRGALVPSRWPRAMSTLACCLVSYAASLLVASSFRPELRSQWFVPSGIGFGQALFMAMVVVVIASVMSNILWSARREVYETLRLGRYRLLARIGRGGHGEVWLARQESLERDVAVKVLRDADLTDNDAAARFRREARVASLLAHPNTIRIIDYGSTSGGVTFVAMELLSGVDADDLVRMSGPLSPARVIHLARQACGSLAEAHDAGIVHRDIKPGNVYVTRAGDDHDFVKILDFGVARPTSGPTLTQKGELVGTLAYMAPEMCTGERVDARSDVYGLGATLYFMLTAQMVFREGTVNELLAAHVNLVPESPSERLGSPIPEDLERVVMRCLAKRREDRYPSMRDLDAALAACADSGRWTTNDSDRAWRTMRPSGKGKASAA